jgi:hypothetical protein
MNFYHHLGFCFGGLGSCRATLANGSGGGNGDEASAFFVVQAGLVFGTGGGNFRGGGREPSSTLGLARAAEGTPFAPVAGSGDLEGGVITPEGFTCNDSGSGTGGFCFARDAGGGGVVRATEGATLALGITGTVAECFNSPVFFATDLSTSSQNFCTEASSVCIQPLKCSPTLVKISL